MSDQNDNHEGEVKKTGHIYDGIEELDHPPPNWFNALFFATIAFGAVYFFYYTLGDGPTLTKEYQTAKDAEEYAMYERQAKNGGSKSFSEDELKAMVKDPAKRALGATLFQARCVSCHGAQGQGGIGPNLTDDYWIHGGKLTEILTTITKGVPEKGMPPWGPMLSSEDILALTVHVRTLLGTNPAGAKAPEGVLVKLE